MESSQKTLWKALRCRAFLQEFLAGKSPERTLAAHQENVLGRNNDYKNIIERTIFNADNEYNTKELDGLYSDLAIRPRHGADKYYGVDLNILDLTCNLMRFIINLY